MLALAASTAMAQRPPSIPVDTTAMDAHLRLLASDLLEGRAPATRGGRLAAEYIAGLVVKDARTVIVLNATRLLSSQEKVALDAAVPEQHEKAEA